MPSGPRIYNLFPLLVGSIAEWERQLPRIADMSFDWLFVNPFHYPGFSGSLYAVKDYYRLNPLFEVGREAPGTQLRRFIDRARDFDLAVMMDLVINHTSKDSELAARHPSWFAREVDGSVRSPSAIDPADSSRVTVWGDLAELDYSPRQGRAKLVHYWKTLVRQYVALGFRGFRCDAAYKIPAEVWSEIISSAREHGDVRFFAETLGCRLEEIAQLYNAGFDYTFNSAKWWDFHESWLMDQYDALRRVAPSIAFPESHDTPRLVTELEARGIHDPAEVEAHYRLRYLFAAFFSAGVLMPIGFEYGFRRPLNVVTTRPEHMERPLFDLSPFIRRVNQMKAAVPALNEEGPLSRLSAPEASHVVLLRSSEDGASRALGVINPEREGSLTIDLARLLAPVGLESFALSDITPPVGPGSEATGRPPPDSPGPGAARAPVLLKPVEMRVYRLSERPAIPRGDTGAVGLEPETASFFDEPGHKNHASGVPTHARARQPAPAEPRPGQTRLTSSSNRTVMIENVHPEIDGGRHPVKREVGDVLEVRADVFKEGHDRIAAAVLYRAHGEAAWREAPMVLEDAGLDRWVGRFRLERNTRYVYTVEAWMDRWETWREEVLKKQAAGQDLELELTEGRLLLLQTLLRVQGTDQQRLQQVLDELDRTDAVADRAALLLSILVQQVMQRHADRSAAARYERELEVVVDRVSARFAAWYTLFPRSQGTVPGRAATFREAEARLPEIRRMGFDVVYLTPIHPIGRTNRKGANNSLVAAPGEPGSPYAIGSEEGGHKAVHPELGTLEDFRHFVQTCRELGMEVALDIAVQCAPDHPYVREHPEWFQFRPDGTLRFAENPPKKYQDIVNLSFYGPHLEALWLELLDIFLFWIAQGVKTFRVDNPHTKPFGFWEWCIREIRGRHPDVIFLAEAFTRPRVLQALAKIGFSQSYTYFTWRNFKQELTDFMVELTQREGAEFLRPNLHVNTPDINPVFLQTGGRPAHMIRLVLAATLSSIYGIYSGFELCEATPLPGTEEYLDSEKYAYKVWDWDRPGNIKDFIARINAVRRENRALHELKNLRFYPASDGNVLFYGKMTPDRGNMIFVAVNLDPFDGHEAVLELPIAEMGIPESETFEVEELVGGSRHLWRGARHSVRLEPRANPAEIYRITVWRHVDYREPCY